MTDLYDLYTKLHSLIHFRSIFEDPVLGRLPALMEAVEENDTIKSLDAYTAFSSRLFEHGADLSDYILDYARNDENYYLLSYSKGNKLSSHAKKCLLSDLMVLQELSALTSAQIKERIVYSGFLPDWENTAHDFQTEYDSYMAGLAKHGYGIFAKYHVFLADTGLTPIKHADKIRLSDLTGYEYERKCVTDNTLALLEGKPAANVLLYGDSGTGKSSTIKAMVNEYKNRGLRLIEVSKKRLENIPALIETLSDNPLKFILFIDDLTFSQDDTGFSILKATLEGSAFARSDNMVIYVTSNRRHLIKESFSDRGDDDIHANETIQQITALNDRFGLTVNFSAPGKEEYLSIVCHIAKIYGIDMEKEELFRRAEVFALHKGGRSPRTARQFVEHLASLIV